MDVQQGGYVDGSGAEEVALSQACVLLHSSLLYTR